MLIIHGRQVSNQLCIVIQQPLVNHVILLGQLYTFLQHLNWIKFRQNLLEMLNVAQVQYPVLSAILVYYGQLFFL
jgi:hypothetical protein